MVAQAFTVFARTKNGENQLELYLILDYTNENIFNNV